MPPNSRPPVPPRATVQPGSEVVPVSVENYRTIVDQLKSNNGAEAKAFRAMFGGNKQLVDRFLSVCFSLLASDSDLLTRATPMSIVEAIKKAASMGLEPMTEDAAIVRYDDKAQLIPMYRGYLKRMRRSGLVKHVGAKMVYANDEFDQWEDDSGFHFKHHPTRQERGDYWGAYAYAVMTDGYVHGVVMTLAELEHIRDTFGRKFTSSGKPLPWTTSFDQMSLKTVLRRLAKIMPQEAVGAEFLGLERDADAAEDRVKVFAKEVRDDLADVRALAMRAVGQLPAGEPTDTTGPEAAGAAEGSTSDAAGDQSGNGGDGGDAEPAGPTEPTATPSAPATTAEAADPGPDPVASVVDPNVRAAMELAAEQERTKQFRRS